MQKQAQQLETPQPEPTLRPCHITSSAPHGLELLVRSLGEFADLLARLIEVVCDDPADRETFRKDLLDHHAHLLALTEYVEEPLGSRVSWLDLRTLIADTADDAENVLDHSVDARALRRKVRRIRESADALRTVVAASLTVVGPEMLICRTPEIVERATARIETEPPLGTPEPVASAFRAAIQGIATATEFLGRLPRL